VLAAQHSDEPHRNGLSARLNWLRAGVLGANDGIISTAHFSTPNGASSPRTRQPNAPSLPTSTAGRA